MRILTTVVLSAAAGSLCAEPARALDSPFRNVTAASGIDFVHSNGATGTKRYQEVVGSGVCVLDADGDGRLDIYFVNSAGANRLYRNLGGLRFVDITETSFVGDSAGYGMGAVAADVDGDGDDDLYVTNYGANRFFLNRGDATFEEIAVRAGVDDPRWSAGAAFFDGDGDQRLDLYVVNYVQPAEPDTNRCFGARGTLPLYCHPRMYSPQADSYFRNVGDARFEDATKAAGFAGIAARGLGVVASDVNGDGHVDLYVANDLNPNFLFQNRGDGTFEDVAAIAGCGYNENGREESGMGIALDDFDGNGLMDILVTNFQNESNTLYRQDSPGWFFDESAVSGLGAPSLPYLAWGAHFLDVDRDGWLDLYVSNGHTESDIELVDQLTTWKQPDQLFRNLGNGSFSVWAAAPLDVPRAGRGAAFADLDDDGDTDVILNPQNGAAVLLENVAGEGKAWIGFDVRAPGANRRGVGWQLAVTGSDGRTQIREFRAGGSYLSGNDPRVLVGLGAATGAVKLTLRRGAGQSVDLGTFEPNRYHVLSGGSP